MTALSPALALAGLSLLALSMPRHAGRAGLSLAVHRAVWLRRAGWGIVALSFASTVARADWRIGIVAWIGAAGLGAAIVTLLLTYRPRALPRLAAAILMLSILSAMLTTGWRA